MQLHHPKRMSLQIWALTWRANTTYKKHLKISVTCVETGFWPQVDQDRNSWCKTHFLNARALKKAKDIYKQLEGHTQNLKIHEDKSSIPSRDKSSVPSKEKGQNDEVAILQAITAGYFLHAATRQEDGAKILYRLLFDTLFPRHLCMAYTSCEFLFQNLLVINYQPSCLSDIKLVFK